MAEHSPPAGAATTLILQANPSSVLPVYSGNETVLDQWKRSSDDKLNDELTDIEMSHEILRLIIRSVEKREKRKRSTVKKHEANESDGDDERTSYSRCSISFLCKVLQKVCSCPRYIELVKWMGFGDILELQECCVPRSFVQFIAEHVNTNEEKIQIGSKSIFLSPLSVIDTLGTPSGELLVDTDEVAGKTTFLEIFGLSEVPSIRFFGEKILAEEQLADDIFCRCFMVVLLGTFLCPNSNTKASTKYMGALVHVDTIKDRNWSKFIHEWMILYIKKFLKDLANGKELCQTLGGCIYHLAVRFLDFIDFGCIQLPTTMPRIKVWKGKLIKLCCDLYMGTDGNYGSFPISFLLIKDLSETCYAINRNTVPEEMITESILQESISNAIGDVIGGKIKQAITTTYVSSMKNEDSKLCLKVQHLVMQVIHAFLSEKSGSQDTVKLSSSPNSGDTLKLSSSGNSGDTLKLSSSANSGDTLKLSSSEHCSLKTANEALNRTQGEVVEEGASDNDIDEDALIGRKRRRVYFNTVSEITTKASPITQGIRNIQDVCSQERVHSASLQHLLRGNDFSRKPTIFELQPRSLDLNLPCIEQEMEGFYGFGGICTQQVSNDCNQSNVDIHDNKDIDVSSPDVPKLGQNNSGKLQSNQKSCCRSEILENARNKYFFKDSDSPSWRLLEDQDDNGKTIEEPELFRPLGMDDYTYNEKCEVAISNCKDEENKVLNSIALETPSISKHDDCNVEICIDNALCESQISIQCAQKEATITGLTNSPVRDYANRDNIVDLISPECNISSKEHNDFNESSTIGRKIHYHGELQLAGRRLFHGNSDDYCEDDLTNSTTPRAMESNIVLVDSPEVKFLGQKYNNSAASEKSPEVQFLGQRAAKNVLTENTSCNSMSREADELYNAGLSLGNASSSHGKENWLPQRIPQRSKYTCSPFDANTKVTITSTHQKIWEAVTTLCDIEPYSMKWAIEIDNVKVKMIQLGSSFKINGWVEAWVINAFCRMLFRNKHPRISLKHFFFNTVSDYFIGRWKVESSNLYWKGKAIESLIWANKAKALTNSEGLYFPTIFENHWFVFMVDMKYRNYIFLDPVFGEESSYHKKVDKMLISKFEETWAESGLKRMNLQSFQRAYPNVPKQRNGNDCGIFVMKYLEWFEARNQSQCTFSHLDVPSFRVRYAHDMLLSEHNVEHDAQFLAVDFHKKGGQC